MSDMLYSNKHFFCIPLSMDH